MQSVMKVGERFYLRLRVPKDLRSLYGTKQHIQYSLKTSDRREAKRLARLELAKIQAQFDQYRHTTTFVNDLPIREVSSLSEWELRQIALTVSLQHLEHDEGERERIKNPDEREAYAQERLAYGAELKRISRSGDLAAHYQAASSVLRLLRINFREKDVTFQRFNRLLLDACIKAADAVSRRIQGEQVASCEVVPKVDCYRPRLPTRTWALSDVTEAVIKRKGQLSPKTILEKRAVARDFDHWLQGKALQQLSRKDCQEYADFLASSGLMHNTVRKKIGFLRNLLEEAMDMEMISENVAARVRLAPSPKKKSRLPYDFDDLKKIFSSPIYTEGFRPKGGRGDAAAWLPLIALFSGARLEEIAQLGIQDVYVEPLEGVLVFRFMDLGEDQEVKTEASRRLVPVHEELVKAGLLRFVASQRDSARTILFHEMKPDPTGSLSGSWSKWWGRYARNVLKIEDRRKVFHSFRHLFVHVLRRAGIQEDVRRALVGHAAHGVHAGYGSEDFPLPPKVSAMKALKYPGLSIHTIA